jgi:putative spermidine/putrescine transport system substrate-binding protein
MTVTRLLWLCIAFAFALPLAAQTAAPPASGGRLVIGLFGGLTGQKLRAIIDGYAKPLGIETVYVEGTSSDMLAKVRAQKNNPQMDLFFGNDQTFALAKSFGLIEKINPALAPNAANIRPEFRDPDGYGVQFEFYPIGLTYRTDKFAEAGIPKPTSWMIYADPRLKGRETLFAPPFAHGYHFLIGLAMGAGKDERDISVAWERLAEIVRNKPMVVPTAGQAATLITRGESWLQMGPALHAKQLLDQGVPVAFVVPKEGTIVFTDFIAPIKGAKNPNDAQRVINHMLSREVQGARIGDLWAGPVTTDVELTPAVKKSLGFDPDGPLPKFHVLDVEVINKQLDQWVDRFNRTMAP